MDMLRGVLGMWSKYTGEEAISSNLAVINQNSIFIVRLIQKLETCLVASYIEEQLLFRVRE